jgi:hypothetical protein
MRPLIASRESRKSPLVPAALFGFAALAAWKLAGFIASGDTDSLIYALLIFIGSAITLTILRDWRRGLYLFLAWLVFEDFARKYLGNNMVIYFAKDFLAAFLYLSLFLAWRRRQAASFRPPFWIPLLILFWFGVIQVFNPASPHIVYGLLGMKLFFYYVPLLFVGYSFAHSERELRHFLYFSAALFLIVASLGIAQAILGPTFLNPQHLGEDIRSLATLYRVSPESGQLSYRPTSVFVSASRYADLLLLAAILIPGFSGFLLLRRLRGKNLVFLVFGVIFASILLSVSRGTLLWGTGSTLVMIAAFVWGAPWRQREVMPVIRTVQRAALGMVLAFIALSFIFPEALSSRLTFYRETLAPDSQNSELSHRAWGYPVRNFLGAFDYPRWPYGYGIGTTALGTQYIARIFNAKPLVTGVESGYGTLVVEMGILGLIFWFVMSFAILWCSWRVIGSLKGSPFFPLGFAIFWYSFLVLFPLTFTGMQTFEDFIMNAYLWLLLGILFRLPALAKAPAGQESLSVFIPRSAVANRV